MFSPGERDDARSQAKDWRSRLVEFYGVYNRDKLNEVDGILERYKGQVCVCVCTGAGAASRLSA